MMNKEKIHIVDDDRRLCRLLGRYLEHDGYEVTFATSGDCINQRVLDSSISLLLLDVMLPGKDGLTLAREVRELSNVPIIFLTARADITDKVKGLELGADDGLLGGKRGQPRNPDRVRRGRPGHHVHRPDLQ